MERYFLLMSEEDWARERLRYGNDGRPLVSFSDEGEMVINDPWLAEIDAAARRNAGL